MTYDTIHPWQDRNDPVSTRRPITFNPEQRRHAPFRFPGDTACHRTQRNRKEWTRHQLGGSSVSWKVGEAVVVA
jgi:hypothetical protein